MTYTIIKLRVLEFADRILERWQVGKKSLVLRLTVKSEQNLGIYESRKDMIDDLT